MRKEILKTSKAEFEFVSGDKGTSGIKKGVKGQSNWITQVLIEFKKKKVKYFCRNRILELRQCSHVFRYWYQQWVSVMHFKSVEIREH